MTWEMNGYNCEESQRFAKIFRLAGIKEDSMNQILWVLHQPNFNINNLAPSVYFLKQIEKVHLPPSMVSN